MNEILTVAGDIILGAQFLTLTIMLFVGYWSLITDPTNTETMKVLAVMAVLTLVIIAMRL